MRGLAYRVLAALAASLFFATAASAGAHAAGQHRARSAAGAAKRGGAAHGGAAHGGTHQSGDESATLSSSQLWATVDVCKASAEPVVGIRGSMPTDGHPHDLMYMRFGVEYLDSETGKWTYLPNGTERKFSKLGAANATRQAGRDFHLESPGNGASFQLRGVVEFQWRRAGKVVLSATRQTSAGHRSAVLHAEPPRFSAASCTIE